MAFFECPSCHRQYAKAKSGALTYRWLHPVSLPLYCVIFEKSPVDHSRRVADLLLRQNSQDLLAAIISEIELELEEPTQQVREILGNVANEEKCRQFLAAVADFVKSGLAKS
jgi:hypothetical protein